MNGCDFLRMFLFSPFTCEVFYVSLWVSHLESALGHCVTRVSTKMLVSRNIYIAFGSLRSRFFLSATGVKQGFLLCVCSFVISSSVALGTLLFIESLKHFAEASAHYVSFCSAQNHASFSISFYFRTDKARWGILPSDHCMTSKPKSLCCLCTISRSMFGKRQMYILWRETREQGRDHISETLDACMYVTEAMRARPDRLKLSWKRTLDCIEWDCWVHWTVFVSVPKCSRSNWKSWGWEESSVVKSTAALPEYSVSVPNAHKAPGPVIQSSGRSRQCTHVLVHTHWKSIHTNT